MHGRATHARSIKRAFTIDQRSIEVDHELKTVVTREARRPRQLFARLCKYLAAERRTRRWARLVGVHARPAPSNLQRYGARECTYVRASRRADIIILGPPPPIFTSVGPECGPSRQFPTDYRTRGPCEPCAHQGSRVLDRSSGIRWIPEVHRQPPIPYDR